MERKSFRLIMSEDAKVFIDGLPKPAADKIRYNIRRVMGGERNNEIFKKLENTDIWEFRTLCNKTAYRLFAFIKKTQKTPAKEIAKAETIMKYYFKNKKR